MTVAQQLIFMKTLPRRDEEYQRIQQIPSLQLLAGEQLEQKALFGYSLLNAKLLTSQNLREFF